MDLMQIDRQASRIAFIMPACLTWLVCVSSSGHPICARLFFQTFCE